MKRDSINYTVVGLVVLLALVLLLASLFVITGKRGGSVSYFVRYADVTGLSFGAPVFYQGFRIGQVDAIEPQRRAGKTEYRVELAVRRDWRVPKDSVALLASSGLLADVAVAIREGSSVELLKPGAELTGQVGGDVFAAVNGLAQELSVLTKDRLRPLLETLSTRVDSISARVDASTPTLLAEAERLLKQLNRASTSVNAVLSTSNRQHVDQMLADLAATAGNVKQVSADLEATRVALDQLLAELHGTVSDNRPELQQAVADFGQVTRSLARRIEAISQNLEASSRNFNEFAREVRQHPNRLMFSPKADAVIVEDEHP
jgi:phospholipid/cholesterol/gamma-HCH transport system substrate-binding protein